MRQLRVTRVHMFTDWRRSSDVRRLRVIATRAAAAWVEATRQENWKLSSFCDYWIDLCPGKFGGKESPVQISEQAQTRDRGRIRGRRWGWYQMRWSSSWNAQCSFCATIKWEICRVWDLIVSEKSDLRKDRYDEIRRILIKIAQGYQLLLLWFVKVSFEFKNYLQHLLIQREKFLIPSWKEKIVERAKKEELEKEQQRSLSRRSFKVSASHSAGPLAPDQTTDMLRNISQGRVTPGSRAEAHALKYQPSRGHQEVKTGKRESLRLDCF